jgi:hypothetical protein
MAVTAILARSHVRIGARAASVIELGLGDDNRADATTAKVLRSLLGDASKR